MDEAVAHCTQAKREIEDANGAFIVCYWVACDAGKPVVARAS